MKEQILSILNESPELSVDKAKKIAEILIAVPSWDADELEPVALDILQSFEAFKKMKLEKGMFVCEIEKPVFNEDGYTGRSQDIYETYLWDYESALKQVIFAGFESVEMHRAFMRIGDSIIMLDFSSNHLLIINCGNTKVSEYLPHEATIGDLETEIERYNRTAKEKIHLEFTENVLTILGIKI